MIRLFCSSVVATEQERSINVNMVNVNNSKQAVINELHKPARRNFPRRRTVLKDMHDLYQADLVEMQFCSINNKRYKYILTLINCFTKVAYAVPLKDKKGNTVAGAMEKIIKSNGIKFKHLQTDDGKEFYNKTFANLMKRYSINHYSTKSEKKASIIERFNRTLKTSMYKRFSLRGDYVWFDILSDLIKKYNNTFHRTIGMKPIEVNKSNEKLVLERIKKQTTPAVEKCPPKSFLIGDKVRISKYKNVFAKGYLPNWTNEVFEVYRVQPTIPETYILKDNKGEILQGSFYGHEMLKSTIGDIYLVEKILKRKKDKLYVRWLGFDRSHDAWVAKKDLL